jgi:hypothetical protein
MLTSIMRHSDPFMKLRESSYRRGLHLNELEKQIVLKEGFDEIVNECRKMIDTLSSPHHNHRDTPLRGVIPKARHATATCCRKCLYNWHKIPRCRPLSAEEQIYIVRMAVRWIKKEILRDGNVYA